MPIDYSIDAHSSVPLWLQLRNRLIFLIESSELQAGERLPTVRELAVEIQVNYNTISKVYQSLLHDGYLVSKRGAGTFVSDAWKSAGPAGDSPADGVIDRMIDRCLEIGVPLDQIEEQVRKRIERRLG